MRWSPVLPKRKQNLLHFRHPSCSSWKYKTGNKSYSIGSTGKRKGIVDIRNMSATSSVKRISQNSQPNRDGIRKTYEGMISTSTLSTFGFITSLWAATLYQVSYDRKNKTWNIVLIIYLTMLHVKHVTYFKIQR